MDEYALLLRSKSDHSELKRLVHDLLNIDAECPEVWVASAIYWDMRNDKERAATYVDKVVFRFHQLRNLYSLIYLFLDVVVYLRALWWMRDIHSPTL